MSNFISFLIPSYTCIVFEELQVFFDYKYICIMLSFVISFTLMILSCDTRSQKRWNNSCVFLYSFSIYIKIYILYLKSIQVIFDPLRLSPIFDLIIYYYSRYMNDWKTHSYFKFLIIYISILIFYLYLSPLSHDLNINHQYQLR